MMIAKTKHIWPLKNIVKRKKTFVLFCKYEEQVIWVPKETYWQILSSSHDPQMWILRRAHTWQIYPQGKEKFHLLSNIPEIRWPCSQVVDQPWHAKCLSCASCAQPLREKCFVKNRYFQPITTNYYYNVDPLQRCVLPRGLLPQIRHQVRWLPGGHRSQLSGSNQRQTLTEIRVWVLKKPLLRCGELKITFTTSTASSAFSAAGNWWAMQLTHRVVAKLTSWVVAKFTSWVLCFLAALAALYLHGQLSDWVCDSWLSIWARHSSRNLSSLENKLAAISGFPHGQDGQPGWLSWLSWSSWS